MTTTSNPPSRVDITKCSGKDVLMRLLRQEYQACFDMLVGATGHGWHAQTPCERWEVRDIAGHLLDGAFCYIGYFKQGEHGFETDEPRGLRHYAETLGDTALEYRGVYRWELLGRLDACVEVLFTYFDRLTDNQWTGRLVPHRWVGPVPAFMMAAFQLMDYSVHNWDLRKALGKDAYVDREASDVLVPLMFQLMQGCFAPERAGAVDLTVDIEITTPSEEHWSVQVRNGALTYAPGTVENPDAVFRFASDEFCLDVYERIEGGTATGDESAIRTFRRLFFTI